MSPRSRNSSAVAWPMPEAAPVTTTMRGSVMTTDRSSRTRTRSSEPLVEVSSSKPRLMLKLMTATHHRPAGRALRRRHLGDPVLRVPRADLVAADDGQPAPLRPVDAAPGRLHQDRPADRADPRGDRRGTGHAPRPAYADQGRLAPAQPGLAAAARRPDPPHRAAARPPGRLHRLRLPQPQVLRPHQPRRRPRRPRPGRRAARPRQAAVVIGSQPRLAWFRDRRRAPSSTTGG